MRLFFDGTAKEFDIVTGKLPEIDFTPPDDDGDLIVLAAKDFVDTAGSNESAAGPRVGKLQRLVILSRWIGSGGGLRHWSKVSDKIIVDSMEKVAASKGLVAPAAFGDNLVPFFEFLLKNWEEIFAAIKAVLLLFGVVI
jgi:hypothetical protein